MQTVRLSTARLQLRLHEAQDDTQIALLANDPAIGLMMNLTYPYTIKKAKRWIINSNKLFKQGKRLALAVVLAETQTLIGVVSLSIDNKHNTAELGYWLGRDYWQRGYATEAVQCVVDYAFDKLQLASLEAHMLATNEASDRVLVKIGMHRQAVSMQAIERFGQTYDQYDYVLDNPRIVNDG